jgi:hypothetical protein
MLLSGRLAALVAGLSLSLLAACAPVPAHAPKPPAPLEAEPAAPAATAEPPAPPGEPTEGQPLAPVDERTMTCAALSSASDDDKAYAASFLLGYRSALIHSHAIDTKQIEAIEIAALADCATTPTALASKVFAVELIKIGAGTAPRPSYPLYPPYRGFHRALPAQAAPGQLAPDQTPPLQTEPNQAPPMQYAPAQTTPAQATPPWEPPSEAAPAPTPTPAPTPAPAPSPPTPPPAAEPSPAPPTPAPAPPAASPPAASPTETPPSESPQK